MKYLGLLWFCLAVTSSILAQDTGQITGTVRDPSGASIANAQITVSGSEGGANRVTKTNSDGEYVVGGLAGGTYDLQIEAPGFRKYQAKGIVLRVAQKIRADATLQVGGSTSEVTVEGSGVGGVETQSSEMAGVITGKEISSAATERAQLHPTCHFDSRGQQSKRAG